MAYRSTGRTNAELARNMHRQGLITSDKVLQAFLSIDRGHFVPQDCRDRAYADEPVHSGVFHLSAPHMYATVLETLDLSEGLSFLNIGSGTGYLSYLVAKIIGPFNFNHGIEQHKELVEHALSRCARYPEYREFNFIRFRCGDAFTLNPLKKRNNNRSNDNDGTRYDRIYVGGGVHEDATLIFRELLNIGGIMVVPRNEELVCIQKVCNQKTSENNYISRVITGVRFEQLKEPDPKLLRLIKNVDLAEENEIQQVLVSPVFGVTTAKIIRV